MRRFLFILALLCSAAHAQILGPILFGGATTAFVSCGSATNYTDSFTLTMAAQSGLSADLTNKDVYWSGNALLKSTGNSGKSQSSGVDVVFCTTNDNAGSIITYEFISSSFNAATGAGQWHIKWPTVSKTVTTVVYGLVGKASATDFSCGTSCTALYANCLAVVHMGGFNGTSDTFSGTDSCGNHAGTNHSVTGTHGGTGPWVGTEGQVTAGNWYDFGATLAMNGSFSIEGVIGNGTATTDKHTMGNTQNSGSNPGVQIRTHTGTPCVGGGSAACLKLAILDASSHQTNVGCTACNVGNTQTGHHWMFTHTSGTGGTAGVGIYFDGNLQTSTDFGSTTPNATNAGTSTSNWNWFKVPGLASGNWPGTLDEMKIYSVVQSGDFELFDYNNYSGTVTITLSTP